MANARKTQTHRSTNTADRRNAAHQHIVESLVALNRLAQQHGLSFDECDEVAGDIWDEEAELNASVTLPTGFGKLLHVSSDTLSPATRARLAQGSIKAGYHDVGEGWLFEIPKEAGKLRDLPDDLTAVLSHGRALDSSHVLFDPEAATAHGLPIYERTAPRTARSWPSRRSEEQVALGL